jgi:hypothetical protein
MGVHAKREESRRAGGGGEGGGQRRRQTTNDRCGRGQERGGMRTKNPTPPPHVQHRTYRHDALAILGKAAVELATVLALTHPQETRRVLDESSIVADEHHSSRERANGLRQRIDLQTASRSTPSSRRYHRQNRGAPTQETTNANTNCSSCNYNCITLHFHHVTKRTTATRHSHSPRPSGSSARPGTGCAGSAGSAT